MLKISYDRGSVQLLQEFLSSKSSSWTMHHSWAIITFSESSWMFEGHTQFSETRVAWHHALYRQAYGQMLDPYEAAAQFFWKDIQSQRLHKSLVTPLTLLFSVACFLTCLILPEYFSDFWEAILSDWNFGTSWVSSGYFFTVSWLWRLLGIVYFHLLPLA